MTDLIKTGIFVLAAARCRVGQDVDDERLELPAAEQGDD
jgi:hypothetical protein